MNKLFEIARHLSLDVALGSLGGGMMVAKWLEVEMPLAWHLILPLAVWLIYTLDHLLDGNKLGETAHSERHLFHYRYQKAIGIVWGILFLIGIVITVLYLPWNMIYFGLILGAAVLGHLGLVQLIGNKTSPLLMKELAVGGIYTAGVWGSPFMMYDGSVELVHWLAISQFFILAMVNLLEFSLFELKIDTIDKQTSFVRAIGPRRTRLLLSLLLALMFYFGVYVLTSFTGQFEFVVEWIFMMMGAVLGGILLFPNWFAKGERYRICGDGVFLLPFFAVML